MRKITEASKKQVSGQQPVKGIGEKPLLINDQKFYCDFLVISFNK